MAEKSLESWTRLRSVGSADGIMEVPSIASAVDTGYGPVRFSLGPKGEPRLMVPCGEGTRLPDDRSSASLVRTISKYSLSGAQTSFIDVMCPTQSLDEVFASLSDEIVSRISEGKPPLIAVESTISDFRELLTNSQGQEVADHKILGLIGELVVLRLLASRSPEAVSAWTGPFDQRHDFRRREHAIEVKTSFRADAHSIAVSSIEQLSEPAGGTLTLAHVRMERSDNGALSISDLVFDIVKLGGSERLLGEALMAMGCTGAGRPEWNRIRFELEGVRAYRVTSGFPRISAAQFEGGSLPFGVSGVSYLVDLASARDFEMSDAQLSDLVSEMTS